MNHIPPSERTFSLTLKIESFYRLYLFWLRYLAERLGVRNTRSLWREAFADYDDAYTQRILSADWVLAEPDDIQVNEAGVSKIVADYFPPGNPFLPAEEAREIIEQTPPIRQIIVRHGFHPITREITAYETLHLRFDGFAKLAEGLIENYGKEGELIGYDLLVAERVAAQEGETGSVEDFIRDFASEQDTANIFTAGLEIEMVHTEARECISYVHACEWARYFQDHHPSVGYLMACSTDDAAYKAYNPQLRMQRTQTLMAGGSYCDFRVFAVED